MNDQSHSTTRKALAINFDETRFGTFAEIGAGQEVARYFFQAGRASSTVAKTMSAYDKVFSDAIYGKGSRFVSEQRLTKMLAHEYELINERLSEIRGGNTCFFAFSSTVATSSHEDNSDCHGWMGVRFQTEPMGPVNDIVLHVRMLDRMRLQQQEALGILGVNLLFASFYLNEMLTDFVASLMENIPFDRLVLDCIKVSGKNVEQIDNYLLNLELVKQGFTRAVLFSPEGRMIQASDALYDKVLVVQRGTFRPVTNVNVELMAKGIEQAHIDYNSPKKNILPIMELSMAHLLSEGRVDQKDFLDRVRTITHLGYHVLVTQYPLFYQVKEYLRRATQRHIFMLVGASLLPELFNADHYKDLSGGILEAMGKLFDDRSHMLVCPTRNEDELQSLTNFKVSAELNSLVSYLAENKNLDSLKGGEELAEQKSTEYVRKLMESGDKAWVDYVPANISKLIYSSNLFGVES